MMMEPVGFHANPETKETNSYQHEDPDDIKTVNAKAVREFRAFRDALVAAGVTVTTALGDDRSPDDTFCNNWVSTHEGAKMTLYPMLADNRRIERRTDMLEILSRTYTDITDLSAYENEGKFLESTGAMCMDRINNIAYLARSARSNEELAKIWCKKHDYELVPFDTKHKGKPVYHTDVVMWIGTKVAGICSGCIRTPGIVERLRQTREVIEFTNAQLMKFAGNALEVVNKNGEHLLVMSKRATQALDEEQHTRLNKYYKTIIEADIRTIEKYGGGSARCMLLEMY